jgi:hypothetical protein
MLAHSDSRNSTSTDSLVTVSAQSRPKNPVRQSQFALQSGFVIEQLLRMRLLVSLYTHVPCPLQSFGQALDTSAHLPPTQLPVTQPAALTQALPMSARVVPALQAMLESPSTPR